MFDAALFDLSDRRLQSRVRLFAPMDIFQLRLERVDLSMSLKSRMKPFRSLRSQ